MMSNRFDDIKKIRKVIIDGLDGFSATELNQVPEGFNNNIIWNIAHLIASQQGLCYLRSGQEMPLGQEFFNLYKAGTKPEAEVTEEEISRIKELLFSTIDELETDYNKQIFNNYHAFTSRYAIELDSIDKVLSYLLFHEGIHFGTISTLKRLVRP